MHMHMSMGAALIVLTCIYALIAVIVLVIKIKHEKPDCKVLHQTARDEEYFYGKVVSDSVIDHLAECKKYTVDTHGKVVLSYPPRKG